MEVASIRHRISLPCRYIVATVLRPNHTTNRYIEHMLQELRLGSQRVGLDFAEGQDIQAAAPTAMHGRSGGLALQPSVSFLNLSPELQADDRACCEPCFPLLTDCEPRPRLVVSKLRERKSVPELPRDPLCPYKELSEKATQMKATERAFAAALSSGSVVTWGDADYGGDSEHVQVPLQQRSECRVGLRSPAQRRPRDHVLVSITHVQQAVAICIFV